MCGMRGSVYNGFSSMTLQVIDRISKASQSHVEIPACFQSNLSHNLLH